MATKSLLFLFLFLFICFKIPNAPAQIDNASLQLMTETLEWTYSSFTHNESKQEEEDDELNRRSLYWKSRAPRRHYISYGALSANRIPCPPRSGRSYYTPSCHRARGAVNPYTRGCSAITRCRM
ncbi:RALF-like 34 [Olea europaea subsp. europaea]|uniref:RALF-like 34 n=2 Tax=Olea europaea subsp. europaea TaxID=158383 RepID=A0A8S0S9J1_OLEEU|nr:RALF-like 34 [Olea europaea subsp. europaea]